MIPLQLSVSDQTTVSFDPFARLDKQVGQNIYVNSPGAGGGGFTQYLPWILLAAVAYVAYRILR